MPCVVLPGIASSIVFNTGNSDFISARLCVTIALCLAWSTLITRNFKIAPGATLDDVVRPTTSDTWNGGQSALTPSASFTMAPKCSVAKTSPLTIIPGTSSSKLKNGCSKTDLFKLTLATASNNRCPITRTFTCFPTLYFFSTFSTWSSERCETCAYPAMLPFFPPLLIWRDTPTFGSTRFITAFSKIDPVDGRMLADDCALSKCGWRDKPTRLFWASTKITRERTFCPSLQDEVSSAAMWKQSIVPEKYVRKETEIPSSRTDFTRAFTNMPGRIVDINVDLFSSAIALAHRFVSALTLYTWIPLSLLPPPFFLLLLLLLSSFFAFGVDVITTSTSWPGRSDSCSSPRLSRGKNPEQSSIPNATMYPWSSTEVTIAGTAAPSDKHPLSNPVHTCERRSVNSIRLPPVFPSSRFTTAHRTICPTRNRDSKPIFPFVPPSFSSSSSPLLSSLLLLLLLLLNSSSEEGYADVFLLLLWPLPLVWK